MKRFLAALTALLAVSLTAASAEAFCGFYVASADTSLFNQSSKVVLARSGDRTVITMANDYQGDLDEFAIVIPVPTFIEREQIHVTENAIVDHLDAYTAPRLVQYFDDDPCRPIVIYDGRVEMSAGEVPSEGGSRARGVTVEASYTVGEYDIQILSATESTGLAAWLTENGYRIPDGAEPVLESYLRQGVRFFVAKVNLEEQQRLGYNYLRPLQVAYETDRFMLPIRLGTVNANGPQELFLFTLTRNGRVETTNYRTVRMPTGQSIPLFVEDDFADFYTAMFDRQVDQTGMRAVFLEYAWDMAWCDPCAADPLSPAQLRELGAFWVQDDGDSQARDAFVTRLHVRYDAETFPEDLMLHETGDRENFQGRYVLTRPWTGAVDCPAGRDYVAALPRRFETEAQTLASLTGWDISDIRARMEAGGQPFTVDNDDADWWERLWDD